MNECPLFGKRNEPSALYCDARPQRVSMAKGNRVFRGDLRR